MAVLDRLDGSEAVGTQRVPSKGSRSSSPPEGPASRSTRSASSATARRERWATRSRQAAASGRPVTLVTTATAGIPDGVEVVRVETAQQMADAVFALAPSASVVVMAAAVADFRPASVADTKLKKADGVPEIVLERTPDILAALGTTKPPGQTLVGFAAETDDVCANAAAKLAAKRVDLMVANDVSAPDAGFEVDTNRVVLLDSAGRVDELPLMTKDALAGVILDRVAQARTPGPPDVVGINKEHP